MYISEKNVHQHNLNRVKHSFQIIQKDQKYDLGLLAQIFQQGNIWLRAPFGSMDVPARGCSGT